MNYDPVCGMKVNNIMDLPRSAYKGGMYYFCCPKCKEIFDRNPEVIISGLQYEFNHSTIKPDKCECEDKVLITHGYRW